MQSRTTLSIEDLDKLNLRGNEVILKQLEPEEQVIFSCKVSKTNQKGGVQERTLLVTNRALYNIDFEAKKTVLSSLMPSLVTRRKIPLANIEAITVGCYRLKDELIIHVSGENDYLLSGWNSRREMCIRVLSREYFQITGKKLPSYFREETDLSVFQTNKQDAKARVRKTPKEKLILLGETELQRGLDYVISNKKDFYVK